MNTPDAPVEVPPDCPTCDGYLVPDHYCPNLVIMPVPSPPIAVEVPREPLGF